jgi:hypothetical protein
MWYEINWQQALNWISEQHSDRKNEKKTLRMQQRKPFSKYILRHLYARHTYIYVCLRLHTRARAHTHTHTHKPNVIAAAAGFQQKRLKTLQSPIS